MCRGLFTEECEDYTSLTSTLLHAKQLPLERHAFFAPVPISNEHEDYNDYLGCDGQRERFRHNRQDRRSTAGRDRPNYFILGTPLQQMIQSLAQDTPTSPSGSPSQPS